MANDDDDEHLTQAMRAAVAAVVGRGKTFLSYSQMPQSRTIKESRKRPVREKCRGKKAAVRRASTTLLKAAR